jgi:hypothetical protein
MGNEQSVPVDEPVQKPVVGYHVLRVNPSSPGSVAGLVPFFDFIVSVGDTLLEEEDSKLVDALQQNVGKALTLGVFSSRSESVRFVELTPRNDWGGIGLLGVSIRFNSLKNAEEQVWHVEQVYENSPAEKAGLVAHTDYIVGTPDVLFSDEDDLYMLLRQATTVPLYVYSTVSDDIRIVNVSPNANWGGNGILGCELGYGLLHRIPRSAAPKPASVPPPKIDLTGPKIVLPTNNLVQHPVVHQQQLPSNNLVQHPVVHQQQLPSNNLVQHPVVHQQQLPSNNLVQHPVVHQQQLPSNNLVQHPVVHQQQLPSNNLVQHPVVHQQQLPSNNLVQHPVVHQQQLPSNNLVQHPVVHQQQLPSNNLVQHPVVHQQQLPSNNLVQHPVVHQQQLPSNNLVQHPRQELPSNHVVQRSDPPASSIRVPESPLQSSNDVPLEQAPSTPTRIEVPGGAAPPTSTGKSLDEHKKKLAALQAKMNELRK